MRAGGPRPGHLARRQIRLVPAKARLSMNVTARDALARPAILSVGFWLALSLGPSTLRAEPPDRQVAEWVILMGGSVRLEGQDGRIRDLTQLPAADFHIELADLVGTNINPPDLQRLNKLSRLKIL